MGNGIGGLIHYINGQWTLNRKIVGTIENTSDPIVRAAISPPVVERVFSNGIVVHALPKVMERIIGYFDIEGITPAKTERK